MLWRTIEERRMAYSEEYIKMCNCRDLQYGWVPKQCDYFTPIKEMELDAFTLVDYGYTDYRGGYRAGPIIMPGRVYCIKDASEPFVRKHKKELVWLPSLEQLIDMLPDNYKWNCYYDGKLYCVKTGDASICSKDIKTVFLQIVMARVFNLCWVNGEWIVV